MPRWLKLTASALFGGLLLGTPARSLHAYTLPAVILMADAHAKKTEQARLEKAIAADPKNCTLRFELGAVLCDLAADGEEAAADSALKVFENLRKELPKDPEVMAFYGNACTIEAKYSFVLTKLSWVHDGFHYLDDAVKSAPDDVNVHIIRAMNSAQVPGYLGREDTAREDFAWIMQRKEARPQDFSPDLLRTIYYFAGKFALEHDQPEAVSLFMQAAAIPAGKDDAFSLKIQNYLKTARAKFPAAGDKTS